MVNHEYDYIIIGSGFGGSVSALRLAEKGYKVLVIEKGKRFKSEDFPKSNWDLKRWLWMPFVRFFGFFKITFYRHVGILSGIGVGGGSLVYANTLPIPKDDFFNSGSWKHLSDWKTELQPFYNTAKKMLGVAKNPREENGDTILKYIASNLDKATDFELTDVAVFFGEPEKKVPDPYFNGKGPEREGCRFCGGCMIGCKYNAKNTLDKNYLYLAENLGVKILPEYEVVDIQELSNESQTAYQVVAHSSTSLHKNKKTFKTKGVIFAGGVLGTIPLLLKLKDKSLTKLSDKVGANIRTNNESLLGVISPNTDKNYSEGIAISSIFHTDKYSHIEPVRYPSGSGFWRTQLMPLLEGNNFFTRIVSGIKELVNHPIEWLKILFVKDWASKTQILLYMRTLDSTLKFEKGWLRMKSKLESGLAPTANIPESRELARAFANISGGQPGALISDMLLGIPTTAHILGGAVMSDSIENGVINKDNQVFGYKNMYICDGSAVSANPGVNPSLTITAITERAMSKIPTKID